MCGMRGEEAKSLSGSLMESGMDRERLDHIVEMQLCIIGV